MRKCGTCSLCCKLMGVPSVTEKNKWCKHCSPGCGCIIYDERPDPCRNFQCLWLLDRHFKLADHWYPAKARIVIDVKDTPTRVVAFHVDPDYPLRWREEPWHADIRHIARTGAELGWTTVVLVKDETIQLGL